MNITLGGARVGGGGSMKYWNSTQLIQFPSGISIERDYTEMLISPVSQSSLGQG